MFKFFNRINNETVTRGEHLHEEQNFDYNPKVLKYCPYMEVLKGQKVNTFKKNLLYLDFIPGTNTVY